MKSFYLSVACALGFAGVALGAFGAHALASVVTPPRLATWATAIDYHMFHTLVIWRCWAYSKMNLTFGLLAPCVLLLPALSFFLGACMPLFSQISLFWVLSHPLVASFFWRVGFAL